MRRRFVSYALIAVTLAAGGLCAHVALGAYGAELGTPRDLHQSGFVGSRACARCHRDHERSWHRTFHRTMTQDVTTRGAVLAPFAGERYRYAGLVATMTRDASGAPLIEVADRDGGRVWRGEVVRTVGSRRFQQYVVRGGGGASWRAPMAWSIEDARWMHMNGAFLTPDPARDEPPREAFLRHVTRWNDNCVFCHNTRPSPGYDRATDRFDTEVAELGIACEACHGPGELHVRANTDPLRRYVLHARDGRDPTIVNPARLSAERAADVCGRCHGQRVADRVERFLAHGDPFVPGEPLELYSAPLWQDTTLGARRDDAQPDGATEALPFAERFWSDGTPRLTAYEFQGILQSPCRGLTCTSCHSMHDGDPRGQIRPAMAAPARSGERGDSPAARDALCTGCHEAFAATSAARRHASHRPESARCVDCHMPRIVYGLVDAHRSHRIEVPDPRREAGNERPDACTLCHTGETRAWATLARERLWPRERCEECTLRNDALDDGIPEAARALFGGDPIERGVAARALGDASGLVEPRLGALLLAMEDEYPAVRRIAWRSARRIARGSVEDPVWRAFDPTGDVRARRSAIDGIAARLGRPAAAIDAATIERLRDRQSASRIAIGE